MIVDTERPQTTPPQPQASTAKKRGGGAKTPEGKERCKRNALKHSLLAEMILTDDLAAVVAVRAVEFRREFAPQTPYEAWLVGEIALATAKLDHAAKLTLVDHQRCI